MTAGQCLVHLSGALTLRSLEPAPRRGSLHPLQSFPTLKPPEHFHRITAAVAAGDAELLGELETIARELGATPRVVADEHRILYHAAANTVGPHLVALAGAATDTLAAIGWTRGQALAALLPLLRGTVANLEHDGIPGALIGPIRRGDAGTVARQLAALEEADRELAGLYRALAQRALELAVEAGLDEDSAHRLRAALSAQTRA